MSGNLQVSSSSHWQTLRKAYYAIISCSQAFLFPEVASRPSFTIITLHEQFIINGMINQRFLSIERERGLKHQEQFSHWYLY